MRATQIRVSPEQNALAFAPNDRIFLGEGLFETLKVANGQPCFAELHWHRVRASAESLKIPFDLTAVEWRDCLTQQIKQDNLNFGGIKAILSGGPASRGLTTQGQISGLLLQTFNYVRPVNPIRLISATWLRDKLNPVYHHKTINYLEAITAQRQALAKQADDVLFYNMQHQATETTHANVFIIKDNQLITPPLIDGVLPGIFRARLLMFCAQQKIACHERSLTKSDLLAADAVFTTNSLQGIRLVASLDGVIIPLKHDLLQRFEIFSTESLL